MSRTINPIRKAIVKQSLLNGNTCTQALLDGGCKESTAKHRVRSNNTLLNVVRQEILEEFKITDVTVENVLKNLEELKKLALDKNDVTNALRVEELKGKYLMMFGEKRETKNVNTNITKEEIDTRLNRLNGLI